ncbi:MAG: DUF4249 domain-containing protein [Bacteroidales bacterium]|nr:DUF4249 domain-containing protein [Bacteroidales bacterium]MCF8402436.1 DUF4249 domain-containing protein [Bacteroidales bacterium]
MKKRVSYLWIIFVAGIIFLPSCEEKIEWKIQSENLNTVVVNAQLTNEFKYQHIHLSRPYTDLNGKAEAVSNADVIVATENQLFSFIESDENPGHYYSQNPIAASVSENYTLNISFEGKQYQAQNYMIPVSNTHLPGWHYDQKSGLYSINWQQGAYNPYEQWMFEAVISWKHLLGNNYPDSLTSAKIMHYTFSTIDVSYVILPLDKDEVLFPKNSIAIVKKYSLTEEYAAYLRALVAETEWQGSLFEVARGNLPGNISNGGLGYFSACSVIVDTLIVH